MQMILCIELISLHVQRFIPYMNDHCGAMVVINFSLDCFTNSVLAYYHISHIHCLIINLCW